MLPVQVYVTIGWKPNQAADRSTERLVFRLSKKIFVPALPPVGCLLLFGRGRHELAVETVVLDPDEQMFGVYCRDQWHVGPVNDRASAEVDGLLAIGFEPIGTEY